MACSYSWLGYAAPWRGSGPPLRPVHPQFLGDNWGMDPVRPLERAASRSFREKVAGRPARSWGRVAISPFWRENGEIPPDGLFCRVAIPQDLRDNCGIPRNGLLVAPGSRRSCGINARRVIWKRSGHGDAHHGRTTLYRVDGPEPNRSTSPWASNFLRWFTAVRFDTLRAA